MKSTGVTGQAEAWKRQLAQGFSRPSELLEELGLKTSDIRGHIDPNSDFPMRVPRSYVARMARRDPEDPLLLQVLPLLRERQEHPGFSADPLAETAATHGSIVQKYDTRALVIATGACAINCRYCFRREFPYDDHSLSPALLEDAVEYLSNATDVTEVILSGGDPLVLTDDKLAAIVSRLRTIGHLETLRLHTRLPIVLPARMTPALADRLFDSGLKVVIVVHANHPREINDEVRNGLAAFRTRGATLLNQSVLLRGINDSAAVLAGLSRALFDAGILPYYLHLLDRVQGAAAFEVSEVEAQKILGELLQRLPGYLVPKLVREVPGLRHKLPVPPIA